METRVVTFFVLYLSVCGFAQLGHADVVFFDSRQSYRQAIELESEAEVIVESFDQLEGRR